MENGSHVTLALLAPQAPELVEIGVATDAIFAVIILAVLVWRMARYAHTLDADDPLRAEGISHGLLNVTSGAFGLSFGGGAAHCRAASEIDSPRRLRDSSRTLPGGRRGSGSDACGGRLCGQRHLRFGGVVPSRWPQRPVLGAHRRHRALHGRVLAALCGPRCGRGQTRALPGEAVLCLLQSVRVLDDSRRHLQQHHHDVGFGGGHDAFHGVSRRCVPHETRPGGGLEVRHRLHGWRGLRLVRDAARLCERRRHYGRSAPGGVLDSHPSQRAVHGPVPHDDRVRIRGHRFWNQGGPVPHAHVAPRCPLRGAEPGVGPPLRRAFEMCHPHCAALLHSDGGQCGRDVPPDGHDDPGRAVGVLCGLRGVQAERPQAQAGLQLVRERGAHRRMLRHRRPPRASSPGSCTALPTASPRPSCSACPAM